MIDLCIVVVTLRCRVVVLLRCCVVMWLSCCETSGNHPPHQGVKKTHSYTLTVNLIQTDNTSSLFALCCAFILVTLLSNEALNIRGACSHGVHTWECSQRPPADNWWDTTRFLNVILYIYLILLDHVML